MRRREFIINLLLGAAAAWPLAAWAQQQPGRVRRIGVLTSLTADDPQSKARAAALLRGLQPLGAIQAASSGMEVHPIGLRDAREIERAIAAFAQGPTESGGMIVTATPSTAFHRDLITTLAIRHRLPAVYPLRFFADRGGLLSYGADTVDQYRLAASYVDRLLKGEKAADLPVQAPTRYELVINLKTARALGLDVPPMLLARADEVIEQ